MYPFYQVFLLYKLGLRTDCNVAWETAADKKLNKEDP
jgi:hypothetical protein